MESSSLYMAIAKSLEKSGPEWLLAFGVIVILAMIAMRFIPYYSEYRQKQLELEAREIERREKADDENMKLQGQMIITNERSNTVMETMSKQMEYFNVQIEDLRGTTKDMSCDMKEIHRKIMRGE